MARGRLGVVVAVVVVAAACSGGDPQLDAFREGRWAGPVPISGSHVLVAGAPIADGFTVPEGAAMVGGPLPSVTRPVHPDGTTSQWSSVEALLLLLLPGDPRAVVQHLVAQADRQGLELVPSTASPDADGPLCVRRGAAYGCSLVGRARDAGDERWVTLEVVRRPAEDRIGPESFARFTWSDGSTPAPETTVGASTGLGDPAPPLAEDWAPLPEVGEPFGEGYSGRVPPLVVERGSRLVAPTVRGRCVADGYTAVLAVEGDGPSLARAYRAQALRHASELPPREPARYPAADGVQVSGWHASTIDIGWTIRLVERPDQADLLLVEGCYS